MKPYEIFELLNDSTVSKFVAREWIKVNDLSNGEYSVNKNIMFKIPMLRSDMSDYSDEYIVVKGIIDILAAAPNKNDKVEKDVAFKSNAVFSSCISKVNNNLLDNSKDLNGVMFMYNLLEYNQSYSLTSGNLWNYYRC